MMTKEELFDSFSKYHVFSNNEVCKRLEKFFDSNVCITKGKNRHPHADVFHAYAEGTTCQFHYEGDDWDDWMVNNAIEYRIKPSKPTFEYKVCMYFQDGSYEHTNRYFTVNEHETFGFPKTCTIDDATKRERK
jgi:hypothetical protein